MNLATIIGLFATGVLIGLFVPCKSATKKTQRYKRKNPLEPYEFEVRHFYRREKK